jgi:hypothetical protein
MKDQTPERIHLVRKHLRLAALAAVATAGMLGFATPAHAADPAPETKVVTTYVTARTDNGNGTPTKWAVDDFTREVTITGGPVYVLPDNPDLPEVEAPASVARVQQEQPQFTLCDVVKYLHLTWKYHADVQDDGTFVTVAGDTNSPNDGLAVIGGMPGTFTGSFTADFTAPAHWCSFDDSLSDAEVTGDEAPKTSEWVASMFGEKFKGSSINNDWTWTYKTCTEQWWDAADEESSDGTTEAAGDITGKPCPTPSPTPVPTTPAATPATQQLPVTGASVGGVIFLGLALFLAGAALLAGVAVRSRRA